jgi:hypothetical protein
VQSRVEAPEGVRQRRSVNHELTARTACPLVIFDKAVLKALWTSPAGLAIVLSVNWFA